MATYVYRQDLEGRYEVDPTQQDKDGLYMTLDYYKSKGYTEDFKSLGKNEMGEGNTREGSTSVSSKSQPTDTDRVIDTSGNKIIKTVDEYLSMHPELKGRKSARELVQIFIDKWSETGSANQAEDAMYASPLLENAFPGILDTNGVALYTITEYVTEERNYNVALAEAGLNPFLPLLQEKKADLFRNQIDSAEFGARLNEIKNNVIDNPNKETALNVYNQYFAENGQTIAMTDEALLLLAIAPEAGPQLLARNFDITEIGVSASLSGFNIGKGIALDLYERGYRKNEAEELFGQASVALRNAALAEARASGIKGAEVSSNLSIQDYLNAFVEFDADAITTFSRISGLAKSMSSVSVGAQKSQTGEVTGLIE
jgi:hypothetical protein